MNKKFLDTSKQLETDLKKLKETKANIKRITSKITQWSNTLYSKEITNLADIKKFLSEQQTNTQDKDAYIISAVLNCKQQEERIYLNDNLFNKKIKLYLYGPEIDTRCLTDDILQLNRVLYYLIGNSKFDAILYEHSDFKGVRIVTDNYKMPNIKKGYIQDYDASFSAICTENLEEDYIIDVIKKKPNPIKFQINGTRMLSFGDNNISFVVREGTTDEQILKSFKSMKYFNTDKNKISAGEKTLTKEDDVWFIDGYIEPEFFCPSYWIPVNTIRTNYLFDFDIDYNFLYDFLMTSQVGDKGFILYYNNMCYWDTINQCFDFLAVFLLTCPNLNKTNRDFLTQVYDKYINIKPEINKWKNNQLLLQRILQDYINSFLNNSEFIRYVNLHEKVKKYIKERNRLKTNNSVMNFFNDIPFASMIKTQFTTEVMGLADRIEESLNKYINGVRPDNLVEQVKGILKDIFKHIYTPGYKLADLAFPFTAAPGGILGKLYSGVDPLNAKIERNYQTRIKKKKAETKKMDETISSYKTNSEKIDRFVSAFVRKILDNKGIKDEYQYQGIKKRIYEDMGYYNLLNKEVVEEGLKYTPSKKIVTSKYPQMEKAVVRYYNIIKGLNIRKLNKSKNKEEDSDEEMEVEDVNETASFNESNKFVNVTLNPEKNKKKQKKK